MNIINRELVTDTYGEWPSFHDAEILGVSLSLANYESIGKRARATIDINVYLIKNINEVTADFETVTYKENVITFEFNNVEDFNIEGFTYQNVIDDLVFKKQPDGIIVEMISITGAHIRFQCTEIILLKMVSKAEYDA